MHIKLFFSLVFLLCIYWHLISHAVIAQAFSITRFLFFFPWLSQTICSSCRHSLTACIFCAKARVPGRTPLELCEELLLTKNSLFLFCNPFWSVVTWQEDFLPYAIIILSFYQNFWKAFRKRRSIVPIGSFLFSCCSVPSETALRYD